MTSQMFRQGEPLSSTGPLMGPQCGGMQVKEEWSCRCQHKGLLCGAELLRERPDGRGSGASCLGSSPGCATYWLCWMHLLPLTLGFLLHKRRIIHGSASWGFLVDEMG